jgi:ATP/maltotriose-dependent transcriptional regulator MalT
MTVETSALTLIRSKMQRPQLPGDLIPRRRLLDRLCAGSSRKLTLISAQARAGPEGIMEQEQEYLTALGTAATYQISGDSMEMRTAERSIVSSF